jgi:hypothetical protein
MMKRNKLLIACVALLMLGGGTSGWGQYLVPGNYTHTGSTVNRDTHIVDDNGKIKIGGTTTLTANMDEIQFRSYSSWIKFNGPLNYTSTMPEVGNFIVWANGDDPGMRSCIDTIDVVGDNEGFVLFNNNVNISYTNPTDDRGRTWIRSYFDDVKIDKNFTYNNVQGINNGLFLMQAGQDIFGKSDNSPDDNPETSVAHGHHITFTHKGDLPIMMQAKKTIHLLQDLTFNRTDAVRGGRKQFIYYRILLLIVLMQ